jgi:hypothetical protein
MSHNLGPHDTEYDWLQRHNKKTEEGKKEKKSFCQVLCMGYFVSNNTMQ